MRKNLFDVKITLTNKQLRYIRDAIDDAIKWNKNNLISVTGIDGKPVYRAGVIFNKYTSDIKKYKKLHEFICDIMLAASKHASSIKGENNV